MAGSEINQTTEIEFTSRLDDSDAALLPKASIQFASRLFDALVIDDDDLEIGVIAFLQNAGNAFLEQSRLVSRRNNN